jgi:hypothetical protein
MFSSASLIDKTKLPLEHIFPFYQLSYPKIRILDKFLFQNFELAPH